MFTSLLIFSGIYCFYWSEKILILIGDYRKFRNHGSQRKGERRRRRRHVSINSVTGLFGTVSDVGDQATKSTTTTTTAGQADALPASSFYPVSSSSSCPATDVRVGDEEEWTPVSPNDGQRVDIRLLSHSEEEQDERRMEDRVTRTSMSLSDSDQERKDHLAWMVIIGDGIHNLIDGLSLGAALSDSHLTGFSIAIAILFEEIPHELGDYAILVSSGMSPRKAALCNLMSASTCYIGMILGIVCSDLSTSSSNSYIFAVAGGMFLYISIFNVMTDLNENFNTCRGISTCTAMEMLFWQNLGILIGVYILYSLAQFDEKLLLQSLRIEL